jgi:sialidase-1
MALRLTLVCFLVGSTLPGSAAPPIEDVVFTSGKDGYHTYRIPSLAVTSKRTILAICEGRKTSRADHGDVDLVYRRSTDGGKTWSPVTLLYEEGGDAKITIGNPCVIVDGDAVLLLFTRDNKDVFVTTSKDDGRTWQKPRNITADVKRPGWTWYATGPGNGIVLTRGPHKGRLVVPCDHRVGDFRDKGPGMFSHVIISDDHGRTWKLAGITDSHMNECAVAEREDGSLLLNMRSYRGKQRRAVAISTDGGATWGPCLEDAALVESICEGSLLRYSWSGAEKSRLLFANPADPKKRVNVTLRVSYDEGKTWPVAKAICPGSSAYSSLARLPDGDIGLFYERNDYRELVLVRIGLNWLEEMK